MSGFFNIVRQDGKLVSERFFEKIESERGYFIMRKRGVFLLPQNIPDFATRTGDLRETG